MKEMWNIKPRDLAILSHLRQDSRETLTTMSRETRIPVSTIFDKIRFFKESGVIRKNTSIVSFDRFGYTAEAMIFLAACQEERSKLSEVLLSSSNINSLYRINSGWDFMAEAIFPNMREMESFLEAIEEKVALSRQKVFYIIEDLRREDFFSNPEKAVLPNR